MTFTEFFTTYLAVGAPFGAYYFLKHRGKSSDIALSLKSITVALLWFVFAARLLKKWYLSSKASLLGRRWHYSRQRKIEKASQNVINAFTNLSNEVRSVRYFEFREILERFIGLTLASQNSSVNSLGVTHESEIFQIVGHERRALRLAERILHRKNFLRLELHRSSARQDFLRVCRDLKAEISVVSGGKLETWQLYQTEVGRLLDLLKDEEAIQAFLHLRESTFTTPQITAPSEKQELCTTLPPTPSIKNFPVTVSSRRLTTGTQD